MDATFWAAVSLVIFVLILVRLGVPGRVAEALDRRAESIRAELDEARRLREEAQELLADYQLRRKEAEEEASQIVSAAEREAERIAAEAESRTEEFISRRTAMAERRISRAEADAMAEVKKRAVGLAVEACEEILSERLSDSGKADKLIGDSISEARRGLS